MKYFEIQCPYYALLKADSREEAIQEYIAAVADNNKDNPLENEIKEVGYDYALVKFTKSVLENTEIKHPIPFILKDFRDENISLLLTDGSLA